MRTIPDYCNPTEKQNPNITFKFNAKKINYTPKKFVSLFDKALSIKKRKPEA